MCLENTLVLYCPLCVRVCAMFACVYTCIARSTHLQAYTWQSVVTISCLPQLVSILIISWDEEIECGASEVCHTGWPAVGPCNYKAGLPRQLLYARCGSELRTSRLHCEHFAHIPTLLPSTLSDIIPFIEGVRIMHFLSSFCLRVLMRIV